MMDGVEVRPLDDSDVGYALSSWRESHKQSPGLDRVPWRYYKLEYGALFSKLLQDHTRLGAYRGPELLGFLVATPGRRVSTLHWVQVRHKDAAGRDVRRQGVMTQLLAAADLGSRFIYTLRGARRVQVVGGVHLKSLDEALVLWLQERGVTAAYNPLLDWVRE